MDIQQHVTILNLEDEAVRHLILDVYVAEQSPVTQQQSRTSAVITPPTLVEPLESLVSKVRIFVENTIGGMKRYHIFVQRFRNRVTNFEDHVMGICAGLWNLTVLLRDNPIDNTSDSFE